MTYSYQRQLRSGEEQEQLLDAFLGMLYTVRPVSPEQQRAGIDRICSLGTWTCFVEYKTDWTAAKTGNVFIELVSVDRQNQKPGWAYACRADWLLYWMPQCRILVSIQPASLRAALPGWRARFVQKKVSSCWDVPHTDQRICYDTIGLLVPLDVFQQAGQTCFLPLVVAGVSERRKGVLP